MDRIDPRMRAQELQPLLYRDGRILVTDFSDTLQGKDTSRVIDLMPNRDGRFLFRAKFNVKEIDPLSAAVYGKDFVDISQMTDEEIEERLKLGEFDFPLWFKHTPRFSLKRVLDYNIPFTVQVAGCNFHDGSPTGGCRFCFVDNKSNDGLDGPQKVWLSVDDCLESFLAARERIRDYYLERTGREVVLRVLRISGGEPTLVMDWIEDLWREIARRGLLFDIVGQVDTNLSTGYLLGVDQLKRLACYPIKFLAGLKGCDSDNIADNVQATQTLVEQMKAIRLLVDCGLDVYPQMYNPDPASLDAMLEMTDNFCLRNFSRRLHIGLLKLYGPNELRLGLEYQRLKFMSQGQMRDQLTEAEYIGKVEQWFAERYARAVAVMNRYLSRNYGCYYRDTVRSDIKMSVI